MGKKKIVVDTNVLISALGWKGKPKELFDKILNKEYQLMLSKLQLEELERVMNYPKFKFSKEQKQKYLSILLKISEIVEISGKLKIIKEDPADNIILETALNSKAEFIISGDKHLLKFKNYLNIKILTVSDFFRNLY